MRRTWILSGFIAGVFLASAIISPWLYWAAQGIGSLAVQPFPRFVSRTLLVLAAAGLWLVGRGLRVSLAEIGLSKPDPRRIGSGLTIGLASLGLFLVAALWVDGRELRANVTAARVASALGFGLATAGIVSVLEEIIFRGGVFGLMRQGGRWLHALILSSVVFSLTHFLQTPGFGGEVRWFSGFEVVAQMAAWETRNGSPAAQFLNLTLCGFILSLAYQRTGNLWFSVGLHGGWIFLLKLGNALTTTSPGEALHLWGTRKVIDGWGVTPLLLITLAILPLLTRQRTMSHHELQNSAAIARVG